MFNESIWKRLTVT